MVGFTIIFIATLELLVSLCYTKHGGDYMNIYICDDDLGFAKKLHDEIYGILSFMDVNDDKINISTFSSPKALVQRIYSKQGSEIDILFLDISMPEIDGFDIAKICYEQYPEISIIFISDYDERVYYSLRFNPFRFLCKKNYTEHLEEALKSAISKQFKKKNHLLIKSDNEYIPIKISRIVFAEKEKKKNYVVLYCINNQYRYRSNMADFISLVAPHAFIKINSGTVINLEYIETIDQQTITLTNGVKFNISRSLKNDVINSYIRFMRER